MEVTKNPNWSSDQLGSFSITLKGNEGFCPCRLVHSEENRCICKDFAEKIEDKNFEGECHCGYYYKFK